MRILKTWRVKNEVEAIFMKGRSVGGDFWAGCILLVVSLLFYFLFIPREVQSEIQRGLAPSFFPKFAAAWIGIFSIVLLVRVFFSPRQNHPPEEPSIISREGRKGSIYGIFASIAYLVLCSFLGYLISTVMLLSLFPWILGEHRWYLIAVATVATTFGIYVLFGWVMSVQLPGGILFGF
jgi:Tripartite tricarboxylate transporter TctB family